VPLDFTRKNNVALKIALKLAKQNHSHVTLLHAIETIDYAEDEEIADFYESMKKGRERTSRTVRNASRTKKFPLRKKLCLESAAMESSLMLCVRKLT
jgi:hypothetical protein